MKLSFNRVPVWLGAVCLLVSTLHTHAFALLGPFQPWMLATNLYVQPGSIGGPMAITNGYRWNVPVVTYGFDQSFINYFGSNGVTAVNNAIQILNDLPPASQIVVTNYPLNSQNINATAQAQSLTDLKSQTLSLLLEQLGLAQPAFNVYVLHDFDPSVFTQSYLYGLYVAGMPIFYEGDPYHVDPGVSGSSPGYITNFVAGYNFDPITYRPSMYVNQVGYDGIIESFASGRSFFLAASVDPLATSFTAVADAAAGPGGFFTGLTYDDVGGLRYLLSTNTVNFETLLSGVTGAGSNLNSFVNGAWRPGVDKITFMPQPVNSQTGAFLPTTNAFTDRFITNGILKQQQMARTISQPDFLFSAGDVTQVEQGVPLFARTGTTNWLNNAMANWKTNGAGPGVIQPQVKITFNKLGRQPYSDSSTSEDQAAEIAPAQYWGSFDGSSNAPVTYPIPQTGTNQMTVRMWIMFSQNLEKSFAWQPTSLAGTQFLMQTSTNLINWTTLFTVTNNSSVCTYFNENPASFNRFYRLIAQ